MSSPYGRLRDSLNNIHEIVINSFSQAESELNSTGCDNAAYMEIAFLDGKIIRISDYAQISTLNEKDQLHYYPQLDQLFKLTYNNKIYGA